MRSILFLRDRQACPDHREHSSTSRKGCAEIEMGLHVSMQADSLLTISAYMSACSATYQDHVTMTSVLRYTVSCTQDRSEWGQLQAHAICTLCLDTIMLWV